MNEHPRIWSLQEAKAKFSEVVRRAQTEGPQTVTVHGKPAVTIQAVTDVAQRDTRTGADLLKALQSCPYPEVFEHIDSLRLNVPMQFREIDLD